MRPLVALAIAVILLGVAIRRLSLLFRNIAAARKTGLPYLVIPTSDTTYTWQALSKALEPLLRYVPIPYIQLWMDITEQGWHYKQRYKPFEHFGSDTFLTASPERLYMCTSDPAVINEIASRRGDFPKPTYVYEAVDLYGKNLVSTEGAVWQRHRKIASPVFSEALNGLVWTESIKQTTSMVSMWARQPGSSSESMRVETAHVDLASLSLGVLSGAGFGVKLFWPGEDDSGAVGMSSLKPTANHFFSFKEAMGTMLHGLIWIIVLPRWLLRFGPIPYLNNVEKARKDCRLYFEELRDQKTAQLKKGEATKADLLSRLVQSARADEGASGRALSDQELIGNFFIMYFGGHETTAISLFYTFVLLAVNRDSQKAVQADLDSIFGDKSPEQSSYSDYITPLSESLVQAASLEQLRLVPPVVALPKSTNAGPQTLTVQGREIVLPKDTFMHFNIPAVHRNKKYWPHRPSTRNPQKSDIDDYVPERWLLHSSYTPTHVPTQLSEKLSSDTGGSRGMYRPPRGVFIAFSEGQRGCIGRKFAQTEILAVLSTILKSYTIELDVGEWASDEQLAALTQDERHAVYEKACDKTRWLLDNGLESLLTLQLKEGNIPLRVVPRGKESFVF